MRFFVFFFLVVVIYAVDHIGLSFFLFLSGDIDRMLYNLISKDDLKSPMSG